MSYFDSRGLPLSTMSGLAAERYRTGIDLLFSAWPGDAEALDEAIAADPDFALARAARARVHHIRAELPQARAEMAAAEEAVARQGTERERSHVEILSLLIGGQPARALKQTLEHADSWPRDALIAFLPLGAFGLFAFSGMVDHDRARVAFCERHARHFDADDWAFLTLQGWAYAEDGNVRHGRALIERSFGLRPENAHAAHALLHAMYEDGASEEAEKLIADWLPGYGRAGLLHGHIAWHGALAALERDDPGSAIALYTEYIQPPATLGVPVNVVSDTAAFLWRLQAYGHEVPAGLWEEAATYAGSYFQTAGFAFADVHMAILAAANGDKSAVERRAQALMDLNSTGHLSAGPVVPAICHAALAFAGEDYAACARLLEPVAGEAVRIGGSGAQRDMIEDMLLLAWIRSGAAAKARELLDRRLHRRPSPRDARLRDRLGVSHVAG